MARLDEILRSKIKPKEKQAMLVNAVISGEVPVEEFIAVFQSARDADRGACADAMKHISALKPQLLAPHIHTLIEFINDPLPRVKWGVPEAIGNLAKEYPDEVAEAVPYLLKNAVDNAVNTTVIKWCAAYALGEIARYNPECGKQLQPVFESMLQNETNNGVKNVYLKTLKAIERQQ